MSIVDRRVVKLSLPSLGVPFVDSYYNMEDFNHRSKLGRRTTDINTRAAQLIQEMARQVKKHHRELWIFHDGSRKSPFIPSSVDSTTQIIGIGFHTEKRRRGDIDWNDFFVQPTGETSIFYGSGVYGNPPAETKVIPPKEFARYFKYYLDNGSDDVEVKGKQSAEALGHLRRKES